MKSASMLDLHVGNRDAVPTGRIPTVKITGEIASSTAVAYRGAGVWGGFKSPPPKFRRPSKIVPHSTRL